MRRSDRKQPDMAVRSYFRRSNGVDAIAISDVLRALAILGNKASRLDDRTCPRLPSLFWKPSLQQALTVMLPIGGFAVRQNRQVPLDGEGRSQAKRRGRLGLRLGRVAES